jgi:hypothetical protein
VDLDRDAEPGEARDDLIGRRRDVGRVFAS